MSDRVSPPPSVDPRILTRWLEGHFDEDDLGGTSLPWSDLGLGPFFGGRYIDAAGRMVVCTTDPVAHDWPTGVRGRIVRRSAQALLDLKEELTPRLLAGHPENRFVGIGPDFVANSVRVHVASREAADGLSSQQPFRQLIAEGALQIEVLGPIVAS